MMKVNRFGNFRCSLDYGFDAPVTLTTPDDTPDTDGNAYLSLARDDLSGAIDWLALALKGRDDLREALGLELDTLRGVLAAIEQEREVLP